MIINIDRAFTEDNSNWKITKRFPYHSLQNGFSNVRGTIYTRIPGTKLRLVTLVDHRTRREEQVDKTYLT